MEFDELGVKFSVTECVTGWTAVPEREMVNVEFVALLVMLTLPFKAPDADGAKVTSNKAEFPLARIWPEETPPMLNPVPETVTLEMETLDPPVFVSVTGRMMLLPTVTVP